MLNKSKTLAFTLISLVSGQALASYETPPASALGNMHTPFKVAVIKKTAGVSEIKSGHYQEGIDAIAQSAVDSNENFADKLNLCAAKLKLGTFVAAEVACSHAIQAINITEGTNRTNYLKSIAYSNRGIVRHYLADKAGSYADFNHALALDNNEVIQANIKALKHALLKSELLAFNTTY